MSTAPHDRAPKSGAINRPKSPQAIRMSEKNEQLKRELSQMTNRAERAEKQVQTDLLRNLNDRKMLETQRSRNNDLIQAAKVQKEKVKFLQEQVILMRNMIASRPVVVVKHDPTVVGIKPYTVMSDFDRKTKEWSPESGSPIAIREGLK